MDPPSYEESASAYEYQQSVDTKSDPKLSQRFSIREEVGLSRAQHVAALVTKLLPQVRERARQGLAQSTLLLIPSNQGATMRIVDIGAPDLSRSLDPGRKGQLVGFPSDTIPIVIQLEGRQDTLEFWAQQQAIDELKIQLLVSLTDSIPTVIEPLPERPAPPPAVKSSFWSRKQKAPEVKAEPVRKVEKPPISVGVLLDEVHFRTETEYGLYETLRGRCVVIEVDVR